MVVAGGRQSRRRTGADHIHHRHIARQLAYPLPGDRGDGVTGNHQRLHLVLQQKLDNLGGKGFNGRARLHAVRYAGGIAEINDVLHRQTLHQRAYHGKAADTGIEYADRALF